VAVPADTLAHGENRLVVIGPASATPRTNGADAERDPARETWLLREPGSGTRAAADALLAELDIDPPTMILGSNAAVERGVELGLGVGLISLDAAAERISQGSVTVWACPGTPINRPWHLVCYSGEPLGPTALALVRSMVGPGGSLKATAEGGRMLRS
jgi:DNA-binding transcriptional LysR family regulator